MMGHKFDRESRACVCGSAWNWIGNDCSFLTPIPAPAKTSFFDEEDWDQGFFECRRGHAFCARH